MLEPTRQFLWPNFMRNHWRWLMVALLGVMAMTPWLNRHSSELIDAGLKRSLSAYALARGFNGVISMAQDTDLSVSPVGLGVTFSPGELLDPVNDMVEQFSSVLLLASASMGLQRLLLAVSSWWPLNIALLLVLVTWATHRKRDPHPPQEMMANENSFAAVVHSQRPDLAHRVLNNALVFLLLLRFAVPSMALLNEGIYRLFLHDEFTLSQAKISDAKQDMLRIENDFSETPKLAKDGWFDQAQQLLQRTRSALDLKQHFVRIEQTASAVTENVINLMVIFCIHTVFMPLLFLWGGFALLRHLILAR